MGLTKEQVAQHLSFTSSAATKTDDGEERPVNESHRFRGEGGNGAYALLTRSLKKSDSGYHSASMKKAVADEITKLTSNGTWDPRPKPHRVALAEAGSAFVRLHCLRSEKHAETATPESKARLVALGDRVTSGDGSAFVFDDVQSCPCTMSTVRYVTAFSLASGGGPPSSADAIAAYVQSSLPKDITLYAWIDKDLWSPEMAQAARGIDRPVWRLRKSLYGLSCAGHLWQNYLQSHLESLGWSAVENCPQTFVKTSSFTNQTLILTAYVDDIIIGGKGHMLEWESIMRVLQVTPPAVVKKMLGVNFAFTKGKSEHGIFHDISMDMSDFILAAIKKYESDPHALPLSSRVTSPGIEFGDKRISDSDRIEPGKLKSSAASHLMTILYCARMCRPDVIQPIVSLSRNVTKWTKADDLSISLLYSYLKGTAALKLTGRVFEDLSSLRLVTYVDADFCGSVSSTKSISGGICFISSGPFDNDDPSSCASARLPLDWWSKRQGSTATSTTEAELTSLQKGLKDHSTGFEWLIQHTVGDDVPSVYCEDNQSAMAIIRRGFSPMLRHLSKTSRVSIGFLHEAFAGDDSRILVHVGTTQQAADMMTKSLAGPKLQSARELVGLR
jgi:hypothetical protein